MLEGITVLDLASVGPAARASRWLADYGATVVKIGPVPKDTGVQIVPPFYAYSAHRRMLRALLRTGDTPSSARAAMIKRPPHLLVTTPESLYLLVTSAKSRERLRSVPARIVDEIHAVAGNKRGSHLSLTLERLAHVAAQPVQRVGLSATQRPIEAIARLLEKTGKKAEARAEYKRFLDLWKDADAELPEVVEARAKAR